MLFAFTNLILIPHHCSPAYLKNFSPEHPWVEVVENSLSSVSTIRVKSSVHTLRERITEENVEWEQNLVLVNVRIRVIILRVQLSEILSKLPMIGQLKDFQVRSLRLAEWISFTLLCFLGLVWFWWPGCSTSLEK